MKELIYSKAFTMALSQEIFERLKELSNEQKISIAQVARKIFDEYLNRAKLYMDKRRKHKS